MTRHANGYLQRVCTVVAEAFKAGEETLVVHGYRLLFLNIIMWRSKDDDDDDHRQYDNHHHDHHHHPHYKSSALTPGLQLEDPICPDGKGKGAAVDLTISLNSLQISF